MHNRNKRKGWVLYICSEMHWLQYKFYFCNGIVFSFVIIYFFVRTYKIIGKLMSIYLIKTVIYNLKLFILTKRISFINYCGKVSIFRSSANSSDYCVHLSIVTAHWAPFFPRSTFLRNIGNGTARIIVAVKLKIYPTYKRVCMQMHTILSCRHFKGTFEGRLALNIACYACLLANIKLLWKIVFWHKEATMIKLAKDFF